MSYVQTKCDARDSGIKRFVRTIRLDEEGGIAIEDAREKKDGNKENNKGSDVQIPEREGLEHEK